MSRQLPPRANLEHLKKQAKELRAESIRTQPGFQLADAQRQLAREYGFRTWAALKAHVGASPHHTAAGAADTARWVTPRHLRATLTKDGEPRGHVDYQVAEDGRTLVLATPDSVIAFDRLEPDSGRG